MRCLPIVRTSSRYVRSSSSIEEASACWSRRSVAVTFAPWRRSHLAMPTPPPWMPRPMTVTRLSLNQSTVNMLAVMMAHVAAVFDELAAREPHFEHRAGDLEPHAAILTEGADEPDLLVFADDRKPRQHRHAGRQAVDLAEIFERGLDLEAGKVAARDHVEDLAPEGALAADARKMQRERRPERAAVAQAHVHVAFAGGDRREHRLGVRRSEALQVGVEKTDEGRVGVHDAMREGRPFSVVPRQFVNEGGSGLASDPGRPVRRPVAHDDDLAEQAGRDERPHDAADGLLFIVGRHDGRSDDAGLHTGRDEK